MKPYARAQLLFGLAGVFLVSLCSPSVSWASRIHPRGASPSKADIVRLRFTQRPGLSAVSNGNFTFIHGTDSDEGTIISERTGRQTPVSSPPDCVGVTKPVIGPSWLLFDCGSDFDLTRANQPGAYRRLPISPGLSALCGDVVTCGVSAIGADWIAYGGGCYHCSVEQLFQSTSSAEVCSATYGEHVTPDLSRPGLSRRLCLPVGRGPGGQVYSDGRSQLIYSPLRGGTYFLQKCGTHEARRLATGLGGIGGPSAAIAFDSRLVMREGPTYRGKPVLYATDVKTGADFLLPYPSGVFGQFSVALGRGHIYLSDAHDDLWTATIPRRFQ